MASGPADFEFFVQQLALAADLLRAGGIARERLAPAAARAATDSTLYPREAFAIEVVLDRGRIATRSTMTGSATGLGCVLGGRRAGTGGERAMEFVAQARVERLCEQVDAMLETGEPFAAIEAVIDAANLAPDHRDALWLMARALISRRRKPALSTGTTSTGGPARAPRDTVTGIGVRRRSR